MKHTSIRLSEVHITRIEETGQSPTAIIKKALDAYFNLPDEATDLVRRLITEHVEMYHDMRTPYKHNMSTDIKAILEYISSELEAGRELLLSDIAARFGLSTQAIAKSLSPHGIRTKETKRAGVPGRYFTLDMKDMIAKTLSML